MTAWCVVAYQLKQRKHLQSKQNTLLIEDIKYGLSHSKLYEVVQFLFIFKWYDVQVSEFGHVTYAGIGQSTT